MARRARNTIAGARNAPGPAAGMPPIVLLVRGRRVAEVVAAYDDVPRGRAAAVVSSAGTLEIAVNGGSAARRLGLEAGMPVTLIRNRP